MKQHLAVLVNTNRGNYTNEKLIKPTEMTLETHVLFRQGWWIRACKTEGCVLIFQRKVSGNVSAGGIGVLPAGELDSE